MKARNAETDFEAETCPENLLSHSTKSAISEWLGRFAIEVRRHDGKQYPPKTIHLLLMGIQRHMRTVNPNRAISLSGDPEFHTLQNICDNLYRELHSEGICTETKPIAALTEDDECRLWSSGVINLTTPQGLANAVFFYNGKNFCLRGGQEHRDLKFSQLKRKTVEVNGNVRVCYEYTEHGSKNRSGGLKQLKIENKVVVQYEDVNAGLRCHVDILDQYFLKVPKNALEDDVFYLQPLSRTPDDPLKPWFSRQPMGKNKLGQMMKTMSKQAGLSIIYSNHSLRAYGATKLFQHGLPERLIQERTGHRTVEALRKYQRVSDEQRLAVSEIMNNKTTTCNSQPQQGTSSSAPKECHGPPHMPATQQPIPPLSIPSFSGCTFAGPVTLNIVQQQ